jgi:hypothetical protein
MRRLGGPKLIAARDLGRSRVDRVALLVESRSLGGGLMGMTYSPAEVDR